METNTEDRDDDSCVCCGQCNPQVFTSVLLGALACVLVTGGVFLAFHKWDLMWLMVSGVGVVLIVIGAGLHYCGNKNNESQRKRKPSKQRPVNEQSLREQLLPSAPLGNACSISQLSLNMLPPYFPAYGSVSSPQNPQPIGAHSISQIMQINGQSFLVLPIPGEGSTADTQSLAARLSVVFPSEQPSEQNQEIRSGENVTADTGNASQCTGDSGCQTDSTTVSQASLSNYSPPALSNAYQTSDLLPTKKDAELQTSCPSTPQVHSLHLQVKDTHETTASTSGKAPQTIQPTVPSTNLVTLDGASQTEHSSDSENISQNLNSSTGGNDQAQPLITLEPPLEEIIVTETDSNQQAGVAPNDICAGDNVSNATEVASSALTCDVQAQACASTSNIPSSVCDISEEIQRNSVVLSVPDSSIPTVAAEEHHASEPGEMSSSSNDQHVCGSTSLDVDAQAGPSRCDDTAHLTLLNIPDSDTPLPSDQEDELDICGRSSPPPSYDEVAQEIQQSIGAYGLAYGTI